MSNATQKAFMLWLGSDLPEIARASVLSAASAGFDTVLYSDRAQDISHENLTHANWRDIDLPFSPDEVRIKGQDGPCYAAFSDLFRYAVLAQQDGWWFDCDTVVMRPAMAFAPLLSPDQITIGRESDAILNGAVLGSVGRADAQRLFEDAVASFPVLDMWGIVGPALITGHVRTGTINARVLDQSHFYPVHHTEVQTLYQPDHCDALQSAEPAWYCLSLWGEVLARSGLRHLQPPDGSYLQHLFQRRPDLGALTGDRAALADYLAQNLSTLDDMNSGRLALQTVMRKLAARLPRRSA